MHYRQSKKWFLSLCLVGIAPLLSSVSAYAVERDDCLVAALRNAAPNDTVADISILCDGTASGKNIVETLVSDEPLQGPTPLEARVTLEAHTQANPFVITPNKPNYAVYTYTLDPNEEPYRQAIEAEDLKLRSLDRSEIEFQLSLKYYIIDDLFNDRANLSFSFTAHSFWQVFNRDASSPFRETVYEPEANMLFKNDWQVLGFTNAFNSIAINHQSNGQTQLLSRSWNRIIASFVFDKGRYAMSFNPWYRLPESEKKDLKEPDGDDNPDIQNYLGYFDWQHVYKHNNETFTLILRNNLRTDNNKSTFDLSYSRPINGRLKLYVKYFDGYGRGLIDYNSRQKSLSVGFALSDWL